MPTGFTAKLYEGEEQSFEDFALSCARAFGTYGWQRDEPLDVKPAAPKEKPYYERALEEALSDQEEFLAMDDAARDAAWQNYLSEKKEAERQIVESRNKKKKVYTDMLEKVRAWNVTNSSTGLLPKLKGFMEQQLLESIKYDCPPHRPHVYGSREEWEKKTIDSLAGNIEYYREKIIEDKQRVEKGRRETQELYRSLGLEA